MKFEEHKSIIDNIVSKVDDADIREELIKLSNDYKEMIATNETLNNDLKAVTEEKQKYAELNNKLILQQTVKTEKIDDNENNSTEEENKKMSYDDLNFDQRLFM